MRAVLDTNVIVSALIARGSPPGLLLDALHARTYEFVTSEPLISELDRVLNRAHIRQRTGLSDDEIVAFRQLLAERATIVTPVRELAVVASDPADNRVLEAALAGEADYIVSGDADLLTLAEHEGTRIVTPARFLAVLTEAGLDKSV